MDMPVSTIQTKARVGGMAYLATIVTGLFAEAYARGTIWVPGNAAGTSANILASEPLYRLGVGADLIMLACYIVVTVIFFDLFRPVSLTISMAAACFSMIGIAVLAVGTVLLLAVPILLGGDRSLPAFAPEQLQALAFLALKLHGVAYAIAIVFFGFYCCLLGYLILVSGLLPKLIGLLMAIAGLTFLINSFAGVFSPQLAAFIPPFTMLTSLVGEGALAVWLAIFGIDVRALPATA